MQNLHSVLERVVERGEDLSIVYFWLTWHIVYFSNKTLKSAYNKLRTRGACFFFLDFCLIYFVQIDGLFMAFSPSSLQSDLYLCYRFLQGEEVYGGAIPNCTVYDPSGYS